MDLVITLKEYVASNFRQPGIFYIARGKRLKPVNLPGLFVFSRRILTTDLSNHLTLVTDGMGKATCLALAALGCSIAIHYNSAADTAEEVVKQLKSKGVKAKAFQANLSNLR
jgi:short chain dehydrogenase